MYDRPFSVVWDGAERVMRAKPAFPALVDRQGGLLRFVLEDGTNVTVFVESLAADRTRVYVRRSRGARTFVNEAAILDEIAVMIGSRAREIR